MSGVELVDDKGRQFVHGGVDTQVAQVEAQRSVGQPLLHTRHSQGAELQPQFGGEQRLGPSHQGEVTWG